MFHGKRMARLMLISLLTILLIVPTAFANDQVSLVFNGQELKADLYVENGVSYISAASLAKLPGINLDQEGYVALRSFFENKGGKVDWNGDNNQITVSWREKQGEWTADELIVESTAKMQELNTYKMKGEATMKMNIAGPTTGEVPEIPDTTIYQEAVYQQKPLAMYMLQTVKLPLEDMELTEDEQALFEQGNMVTEMVLTENAIYQKTPPFDKWIVQDLAELGMTEKLSNMLQTTPQQSLEIMREFGMINVFGEDAVIDGKEYYTVKTYVDGETFKKVIDDMLGEFDLVNLISTTQELTETDKQLTEEEMAQVVEETQKLVKQMLANLDLNYYIDSLINKDTLLTEYMRIDLNMNFGLDETIVPEGPVNFGMIMKGEYQLFDFGTVVKLPDVSNAITQEEFLAEMKQMMEEMPVETTEQAE